MGTIQRHVAQIQYRQFDTDLAHRRLETAKLRTLCTYIASGHQLADGGQNDLLTEAQNLSLGTGTETAGHDPDDPFTPTRPATLPTDPVPMARIPYDQLPDAPPSIRAGDPTPIPDGARILPFEKLGGMFGGGPR